jgi:hypothetical protein
MMKNVTKTAFTPALDMVERQSRTESGFQVFHDLYTDALEPRALHLYLSTTSMIKIVLLSYKLGLLNASNFLGRKLRSEALIGHAHSGVEMVESSMTHKVGTRRQVRLDLGEIRDSSGTSTCWIISDIISQTLRIAMNLPISTWRAADHDWDEPAHVS